jgi:hypothetical protein
MSERSYLLKVLFKTKKNAQKFFNRFCGINDLTGKSLIAAFIKLLDAEFISDFQNEINEIDNLDSNISIDAPTVRIYFYSLDLETELLVNQFVNEIDSKSVSSIYKMEYQYGSGHHYISRYTRGKYKDIYYTGSADMYLINYNDMFDNESGEKALDKIIDLYKKGKIKSKHDFDQYIEMLKDQEPDLKQFENLHLQKMDHINCLSSNGELALNVALRNKNYKRLFKILFNYQGYLPDPELKDSEGMTAFDICRDLGLMVAYKELEKYRKGATEKAEYLESIQSLRNARNEEERFYELGWAAKCAFEAGKIFEAKEYAEELRMITPNYKDNWYYDEAIHVYNIVLGRVAVKQEQIEEAKKYLIEAGKTPNPESLNDTDMSLAKDLIRIGEYEVAAKFISICKPFWGFKKHVLRKWLLLLKKGKKPNFRDSAI